MTGEPIQALDVGHRAMIGGNVMNFSSPQEKFDALVAAWQDHNAHRSVVKYDHSSYHQIMAMGVVAVPLLLTRLREGEADWIYALKCITCAQPVTPDMAGDFDRVIDAWLDWGRSAGVYLGRI